MTENWTLDRAITFSRDLVNDERPQFRKIGRMLLALKDENLLLGCKRIEELLTPKE